MEWALVPLLVALQEDTVLLHEEEFLSKHSNCHAPSKAKLVIAICGTLDNPTEARHEGSLLLAVAHGERHGIEGLRTVEEQRIACPKRREGCEYILLDGLARREALPEVEAKERCAPFNTTPLLSQDKESGGGRRNKARPLPRKDVLLCRLTARWKRPSSLRRTSLQDILLEEAT